VPLDNLERRDCSYVMSEESPLTPSPEVHVRTRAPAFFRIPKLDAANPATITGKIDNPGLAFIGDSIPNLNFLVLTVIEVNDNAFEFNGAASDAELELAERSPVVHKYPIVIGSSVYVGLSQNFPAAVVIAASFVIASSVIVGAPRSVRVSATQSQEVHRWARAPTFLGIPKLDAANPATIAWKIDHPRLTPIRDSLSNREFVIGAIVEVDNHSLKLNRPAPDLELKRPESRGVVHGNSIVIPPSVDIRPPELFPSTIVASTTLRIRRNAQAEQQEQQTA
jgi:hypothetical protein